jgi:hypothetical protein
VGLTGLTGLRGRTSVVAASSVLGRRVGAEVAVEGIAVVGEEPTASVSVSVSATNPVAARSASAPVTVPGEGSPIPPTARP